MKKLFIFALMIMLSMSDMALGKVNPDQAPDEEEAEMSLIKRPVCTQYPNHSR